MHAGAYGQVAYHVWLGAWGRPWPVGMHWCGWEHVGVVGTGRWDVGMA